MTKIITTNENTWNAFDAYTITVRQEWLWSVLNEIKPLIAGSLGIEDALLTAEKFRDNKATEAKLKKVCRTRAHIDIRLGILYCAMGKDPYLPAHYCGIALNNIAVFIAQCEANEEYDKAYAEAELVLKVAEDKISDNELHRASSMYAQQIRTKVREQTYNNFWIEAINLLNTMAVKNA
jgi:hypothetical protein